MMTYEQLLSLQKQGDTKNRLRRDEDETRIGFDVDYDRIIFSRPFRSLQDKTQVIPLSKTDFVHTRLTHSLEVSVVGRSLGRAAGAAILKKYPYLVHEHGYQAQDFGAIVAAACLAHDIGNPPFGHSGEKAIGAYFEFGKGAQYQSEMTAAEWQDLICFEGNANGFHVLCGDRAGVEGGIRLTYATLGAFMKYPKASLPHKPTKEISDKKYGFFQADQAFFEEVATALGLLRKDREEVAFQRHPLTFLVEAADDICYTIIDFEDGINLGLISEDFALEYLIRLVEDKLDRRKFAQLQSKEDRISYLRAVAIGSLIQDAVQLFLQHESEILAGTFHRSLMEKSKYKAQIDDIIKLSIDKIYRSREVTEKEINGYEIIQTLLDAFITALERQAAGNERNIDTLILRLLPERFQDTSAPLYRRLLSVCHFVSLLTDSNAVRLYQTVKGLSVL